MGHQEMDEASRNGWPVELISMCRKFKFRMRDDLVKLYRTHFQRVENRFLETYILFSAILDPELAPLPKMEPLQL